MSPVMHYHCAEKYFVLMNVLALVNVLGRHHFNDPILFLLRNKSFDHVSRLMLSHQALAKR
jgi:hypothetical protein